MQVRFLAVQPRNGFMNMNGIQGSQNRNTAASNNIGRNRSRDRATISPQGKLLSAIENLTKQKEALIQQKGDLVSQTLESGNGLKTIESQLEVYEKQLKAIDDQISQLKEEQMKPTIEKEEEKKPQKADENKSEDQITGEKLTNLASVAISVKSAELVSSVKNRVEGNARVEKAEMNLDELSIDRLESIALMGSVNVSEKIANEQRALDIKQDGLSALQEKALSLETIHGAKASEAAETLEELKEPVTEHQNSPEEES